MWVLTSFCMPIITYLSQEGRDRLQPLYFRSLVEEKGAVFF